MSLELLRYMRCWASGHEYRYLKTIKTVVVYGCVKCGWRRYSRRPDWSVS